MRVLGTQNGLGMKSRLSIDNPGVWLDSGLGSAFIVPNKGKYPLSVVSKCAVARPKWS